MSSERSVPSVAEMIRQSDDHLQAIHESLRLMRAHLELSRRAITSSRQTIDTTKPIPERQ